MSDEKHTISTAEQAYQSLAFYLIDFIGIRKWQESRLSATVTPHSVTLCNHWFIFNNEKNEKALGWGDGNILKGATNAVRFLRDNLLATRNRWGQSRLILTN